MDVNCSQWGEEIKTPRLSRGVEFADTEVKKFIKESFLFSVSVSFFYDQYTNLKDQSQHILNGLNIVQSGIIVNSKSHNQILIMSNL